MTCCAASVLATRRCLAVLIASLCAAPTGSARAAAQDVGTEAQRRVGQEALPQVLLAVPRREGRRRRLRRPAPAPEAAQLHDGQVQDSDDAQRRAPDPSGPRQHHPARHAVHVDARLAQLLRPGSVGSRLLHHDLLRRLLERRKCPAARAAPERAELHERVHRAREEALRGHRLRQVPRHARSRRRTVGADAEGRLGPPDPRGRPRAELDLPRRPVPRGHLPDDEHGVQRHADAVVRRRAHARAAMGDHGLHRLAVGSDGPGYTNLVVAKHVDDPIDLAKGAASFASAPVARFPIIGQITEPGREFHPPATAVDRSGDLRCGLDRAARALARHERGEDGKERAVASRATGGRRGAAGRRRRRGASAGRREPVRRPGSGAGQPAGQASSQDPFAGGKRRRPARHPSSPTPSRSRFLRRRRPAPASPTSSSATPRTRWISGSSIWRARLPFSSPAKEARISRRTTRAMSPVSRATTRENGR